MVEGLVCSWDTVRTGMAHHQECGRHLRRGVRSCVVDSNVLLHRFFSISSGNIRCLYHLAEISHKSFAFTVGSWPVWGDFTVFKTPLTSKFCEGARAERWSVVGLQALWNA